MIVYTYINFRRTKFMKKKISRVASLVLAVMMLISLLPAGVLGTGADAGRRF